MRPPIVNTPLKDLSTVRPLSCRDSRLKHDSALVCNGSADAGISRAAVCIPLDNRQQALRTLRHLAVAYLHVS